MGSPDAASLGIAFAMVCLAGLCAPLGACTVLFMRRSHTPLLAASIALAAGVMVFISLTEAFFGGVVLCRGLDWFADSLIHFVGKLSGRSKDSSSRNSNSNSHRNAAPELEQQLCILQDITPCSDDGGCVQHSRTSPKEHIASSDRADEAVDIRIDLIPTGITPSAAAAATVAKTATAAPPQPLHNASEASSSDVSSSSSSTSEQDMDQAVVAAVEQLEDDNCGHLIRTSILVWLALSLHNLPEGLATMVGYLASPHIGVSVAVAIAIHNIPEGIALGVPVYFATGSRWKAIAWTAASGLAEPLGALIGLALQLTGRLNPVAMGIIMATVAGVMTGIAFQELLPRALSYDPGNKYTTHSVFAGMAIMALSLVLLSLWDPSV